METLPPGGAPNGQTAGGPLTREPAEPRGTAPQAGARRCCRPPDQ